MEAGRFTASGGGGTCVDATGVSPSEPDGGHEEAGTESCCANGVGDVSASDVSKGVSGVNGIDVSNGIGGVGGVDGRIGGVRGVNGIA